MAATSQLPLTSAPEIVAVASDRPDEETDPLPIFHLDDIRGHCRFHCQTLEPPIEMTLKLADDCFFHDKDRLPHDEALAILKSRVRSVVATEEVPLDGAAGRYLAESIVAPRPIPAHDNAAVDGYSFAHASYDNAQGTRFKIVGEASAGHPLRKSLQLDGAVRIFTGAVMPNGHDTVAMQEFVGIEEKDGEWFATVPGGLKQGANRRLAGEDSKPGTVLVTPGSRLRPQDVASAAACGLDRLRCYARFGSPSSRLATRSCALGTALSKARSMTPTRRCSTG